MPDNQSMIFLDTNILVYMTAGLVDSAISLKQRYGLQYYDALIVAAAQCLNCSEIYSEDMSDGALYGNVRITNPFV